MAERCLRAANIAHNGAAGQMLKAMADDYLLRAALAESSQAVQEQQQQQPLKEDGKA
jgi:molybdopterin-guanine dinucleotide biosynthesis protein